MTMGCPVNRVTIYFIFQTRALWRLKGVIIHKDARTTGVNQDCPGAHSSSVNTPLRTEPQQPLFKGLRAEGESKTINHDSCPKELAVSLRKQKTDRQLTGGDVSSTLGTCTGFLAKQVGNQGLLS